MLLLSRIIKAKYEKTNVNFDLEMDELMTQKQILMIYVSTLSLRSNSNLNILNLIMLSYTQQIHFISAVEALVTCPMLS